jgi:hypothetical protein
MRLIIAGTRTFKDFKFLEAETLQFLKRHKDLKESVTIVSGRAEGADKLGEKFAKKYGLKLDKIPAQWAELGKAAGHIRNKKMASTASHCIIFWNGLSKGSKNMAEEAEKMKLILKVVNYGHSNS